MDLISSQALVTQTKIRNVEWQDSNKQLPQWHGLTFPFFKARGTKLERKCFYLRITSFSLPHSPKMESLIIIGCIGSFYVLIEKIIINNNKKEK